MKELHRLRERNLVKNQTAENQRTSLTVGVSIP